MGKGDEVLSRAAGALHGREAISTASDGYEYTAATDSQASAASSTATATPTSGNKIVIEGFFGSSGDQDGKIELKFASTVKATMHFTAKNTTGMMFSPGVLAAAVDEVVTLVTTPNATGQCSANIIYRDVTITDEMGGS